MAPGGGAPTPLVCPSCGRSYPGEERFCEDCRLPLVHDLLKVQEPPLTDARERARKIKPQLAEGKLVRVVTARNLTLSAVGGNISVTGPVGSSHPLASLTISNAINATFGNTVTTNGDFTQTTGTGTTTLNGGTIGGNVSINTHAIALNGTTLSMGGGFVTLNAATGGVTQQAGAPVSVTNLRLLGTGNFSLTAPRTYGIQFQYRFIAQDSEIGRSGIKKELLLGAFQFGAA